MSTLGKKDVLAQKPKPLDLGKDPVDIGTHPAVQKYWKNPVVELKEYLAYRGDTRGPEIIFVEGFRRKWDSFSMWVKRWEEKNKATYEGGTGPEKLRQQETGPLTYRPTPDDMVPESAVCTTLDLLVAPLFPVKDLPALKTQQKLGYIEENPWSYVDETWVYVVYLDKYFATYDVQSAKYREDVAWAREVAQNDIPPFHVLACVRCSRKWWGGGIWKAGCKFKMSGEIVRRDKFAGSVHKNEYGMIGSQKGSLIDAAVKKLEVYLGQELEVPIPEDSRNRIREKYTKTTKKPTTSRTVGALVD
jgi:hypothetical protein